jgi:hypothetical protein
MVRGPAKLAFTDDAGSREHGTGDPLDKLGKSSAA